MHSMRTLWSSLLPSPSPPWPTVTTAVAVIVIGGTAWRRSRSALERIGVIALVVVLASPHLFVYDLLLLTPLLLASAERVTGTPGAASLRTLAYLGYLAPLWGVPLAALGLQASTIALVGWLTALTAAVQVTTELPSA